MLDERFSSAAFELAARDEVQCQELCRQLDLEIRSELLARLKPAMHEVINKLNSMGHSLADVSQALGDDMHFREPLPLPRNAPYAYKMIVVADLVLTIGFPSLGERALRDLR